MTRRQKLNKSLNRINHAGVAAEEGLIQVPGSLTTQFPSSVADLLSPEDLANLTPAEMILLQHCLEELSDSGQSPTAQSLLYEDYKWEPVSMAQFLVDPYYFGKPELSGKLYPQLAKLGVECMDVAPRPIEVILGGSIGWGKTVGMSLMLLYLTYRLTCLRNPHAYYNLTKGSAIVIGLYSVSLDQAMDTSYGKIMNWIDEIPYFQEKSPRVKRITTRIRFADSPVEVIAGSREIHTIGKDLFAVGVDECNFLTAKNGEVDEGVAYAIYTGVRNRLKSRFITTTGEPAGMVILASSKRTKVSFLEEHVKEVTADIAIGKARMYSYSQWEVRPAAFYTKPKFRVEIGDRMFPSRILKDGEDPRSGAECIVVPGEYRSEFEQDIDKSLRELAGVATESLLPLIHDKGAIARCAIAEHEHPFSRETFSISTGDDIGIDSFFLPGAMFKVIRSRYVMRINPQFARFIHVDIAFTGDSMGIAMCHISGFKTVRRARHDGTWYEDKAPIVLVDFMLQIRPPRGNEIDLAKMRAFIISLRDYGVPIWRVSFDGFQSRDSVQTFKKLGFDTVVYSVDRTDEAYLSLRQAIMEGRIVYYPYPVFEREVLELERDVDKQTVDHPQKSPSTGLPGSKDVSDAVAGSYFLALSEKRLVPGMGIPSMHSRDNVESQVEVPGGSILWTDLDREVRS